MPHEFVTVPSINKYYFTLPYLSLACINFNTDLLTYKCKPGSVDMII